MPSVQASRQHPAKPVAARKPPASPRRRRPRESTGAENRRLALAILVSTLFHALLLSLTFGGQGLGLPSFGFPWRERRVEAPDLRVVLVPLQVGAAQPGAPAVAEPLLPPVEPAVAIGPALALPPPRTPSSDRMAAALDTAPGTSAGATPAPATRTAAVTVQAPAHSETPQDAALAPVPAPAVVAVERPGLNPLPVPTAPSAPTPAVAAPREEPVTPAPRDAGATAPEPVDSQARDRDLELARLDRTEQETRLQAARLEAERQEAARRAAARQQTARAEAERLEIARQEAARIESARLETERQAAARAEAARNDAERVRNARLEAEHQEALRQEAERTRAARVAAERDEAARQGAAQQEAQRQAMAREAAAQQEAARQQAERAEAARRVAERQEAERQAAARQEAAQAEARREATLRAIGRQLDEEAAKRDAAAAAAGAASRLPSPSSGGRRGRLFGRTDPNTELIRYAEAWARKIELNMTFDLVREVVRQPYRNPMVTVALRSDGSVESVTFVVSSGVAELDEAIRRVVQSQVPYPVFPPGLAREFDVIEIRRTWHFDGAIRLY